MRQHAMEGCRVQATRATSPVLKTVDCCVSRTAKWRRFQWSGADMVVVVVKFVLSPIFSLIALGFLMVQPNLKGILLFALTVLVILIDVYLF